jgi:hypothetical protein
LLFAFFNNASAEVRSERWRWSNPLPHGNNVLDMLVTSSLSIQVGDGGSIYVQGSDERWVPTVSGVTSYLRSVTMMGDRIIVTGENGCILWSDDGVTFQPAQLSPSTTVWFEGVTASTQRAVAVGDNGSIYTSTNGVDWTPANSGTTEWLRGVAVDGNTFVAVGENGKILRSTSGTSWSSINSTTTTHLNRVRYLGSGGSGKFITVGEKGVGLSSTTGTVPWTSLSSGSTNNLFDVASNDTGTLLVGDQEIRFQAKGSSTWTNHVTVLQTNAPPAWVYLSAYGNLTSWLVAGRTGLLIEGTSTNNSAYAWLPSPDSPHAWIWDVTVQNGIYVAVGDLANIQTSLDGILWTREVVPVSHTNTVLLGVGGSTNLLLAVGNAGNVLFSRAGTVEMTVTNIINDTIVVTNELVDTLGIVWTTLPQFTTNTLQGVDASTNLFVVSGDAGKIFTSPDGTNWLERTTLTANFLSSVAIGSNACVAVGDNGTLLRAGPDGATWSAVSLGTSYWLYRVRWLDNQFVVVGENGVIYTSPDAMTWTLHTSGTTSWLTDVTSVNGTWFVTGYQGTLLSSTNRTTWSAVPLPTIKSLYATTTQNGQLVVAGIEGVILRNQVVPHVSPVNFLGYNHSAVTNADLTTSVYELFLFGGLTDQCFNFLSTTNLVMNQWSTNTVLELFDPSGTIYFLRTRVFETPPDAEFYLTQLVLGTTSIYTVTFDAQGGATPTPASTNVTYGSTYGTLATTSRTGYVFGGWWTGVGGTGTQALSTTTVAITSAQTLYAQWIATATTTTLVQVPYAWLDQYPVLLSLASGDYEAMALADADGDGQLGWQEYVAGTVPTNRESVFMSLISLSNGVPWVTWTPDLGTARVYTVYGRTNLTEGTWGTTNASSRFFRVNVGMP